MLEREAGPADKVCGEFISGEAARYLASLGVDLPSLGAVTITSVRLYERAHAAAVALPFAAVSLSRRILDEALLFVSAMPTDKVGLLFLKGSEVVQPDPSRLETYATHAGRRRGHWPTNPEIAAAMLLRATNGEKQPEG